MEYFAGVVVFFAVYAIVRKLSAPKRERGNVYRDPNAPRPRDPSDDLDVR